MLINESMTVLLQLACSLVVVWREIRGWCVHGWESLLLIMISDRKNWQWIGNIVHPRKMRCNEISFGRPPSVTIFKQTLDTCHCLLLTYHCYHSHSPWFKLPFTLQCRGKHGHKHNLHGVNCLKMIYKVNIRWQSPLRIRPLTWMGSLYIASS